MKLITTIITQNGTQQFVETLQDFQTEDEKKNYIQEVKKVFNVVKDSFANGGYGVVTCYDDKIGDIALNTANLVGINLKIVD